VLPEAGFVYIPAEVWEERMGYVAVQLNESLKEATLLGFVEKVSRSELPLSQLRSLQELPGYLNKIKPMVNLSQWFEGIVEVGWQTMETLLGTPSTELALNFRNTPETGVQRCKLIELGEPSQSVVMSVAIVGEPEQDMDISVEVRPTNNQTYLPPTLQLIVLNEDGEAVMDVQAGSDNKTIQLEFSGETGDRFGVKVAWGDVSVIENFVV
jgi:hypothetical protein